MESPFKEFEQQGRTSPAEKNIYKSFIAIGALVMAVFFALEFVMVDDPFYHGFWITIGMLGGGIATVFGYIVYESA